MLTYGDGIGAVDLEALSAAPRLGSARHGDRRPPGQPLRRDARRRQPGDASSTRSRPWPPAGSAAGSSPSTGWCSTSTSTTIRTCCSSTSRSRPLASDGELGVYRHEGFWMGMDTFRDWTELNQLWDRGNPPWKVWQDCPNGATPGCTTTKPMKILVTGTEGYLGCLLAPELLRDGHEVVGVDTGFYKAGWLYSGVDATAADARQGHPPADGRRPRRRRCGRPHGRAVQRPARPAVADASPTRSTTGARCAWPSWPSEAGVERFVYMSSCSVYGVADGEVDETSPVNPQTAYAECKILVERDLRPWPTDTFSPTFLRNATAFGASPRMRFDIVLNNLAGLAWTDEEDRHDQRRHAVASAGARPRHRQGDPLRARRAASTLVHGEVFNVGIQRAELPGAGDRRDRRRPSSRAARSRSAPPAATTAATGCRSTRSPTSCPGSPATGTPPRGARAAARGVPPHRPGRRRPSPVAATPGCSSCST